MALLNRLERLLGRFAVPNLTLYLLAGQVVVLTAAMFARFDVRLIWLVPAFVLEGEVWRLFTFLLVPPVSGQLDLLGAVFLAFGWYVFYLMGSSLESHWGVFRYNLFICVGWALTVAAAFLTPQWPAGNGFLAGTVFLAFAFLNPDFTLYIFFILPVKIKWLALLTWIFYAYSFVTGGWPERLTILAATGNFFLFFGRDVWQLAVTGQRRMGQQRRAVAARAAAPEPRHVCKACGKTDLTHPREDFRYCSKCANDECYCSEHIFNHVHSAAEVKQE
jgi:hypothetical protein